MTSSSSYFSGRTLGAERNNDYVMSYGPAPSQFEAGFLSLAHSAADIDRACDVKEWFTANGKK